MQRMKSPIIYSLLGFFLFSVGDILRKFVLVEYTPIEVQTWACIASVISILLVSSKIGGVKSISKITLPHIHLLKAFLITLIMWCVVFSLERLTLDIFYTLVFTIPLFTSILAALLFKEHLTKQKLAFIALGFIGVLFITRPNSDIDYLGVALTLILSLSFSLNALLNKRFKPTDAKFPFGFVPYILATATFLIANNGSLPDIGLQNIILCAIAGATSVFAMVIHVYAFQHAKAADVAPYQYTQLLWGILFGFILFGDIPNMWVLLGSCIIITSGLLLYFFDNKKPLN